MTNYETLEKITRKKLIKKYHKMTCNQLDDKTKILIIKRLLNMDLYESIKTYRLQSFILNWLTVDQILTN